MGQQNVPLDCAKEDGGALTICPGTNFDGHWQDEGGERILRATLDELKSRGIRRVVVVVVFVFLAALSNGAAGASALVSRFASSLQGLILISGAPANGGTGGLPTLVMHGGHDTMASARTARAFAERTHATYTEFEGGHFVLLTRRQETRAALVDWLTRQAGYRSR